MSKSGLKFSGAGLIVLFQYGVFFQGGQLGCLRELGVLFLCRFCNEEPGTGQHVVDSCDDRKKEQEDAEEEVGTVEGAAEEYEYDGQEIHRYEGQGDGAV
jgi:hypothetical protein